MDAKYGNVHNIESKLFLNTFIVHIHYYILCSIPKLQYFPIPSRISPPIPLCLELLHCVLGAGQLEATRTAKSQLLRLAHLSATR